MNLNNVLQLIAVAPIIVQTVNFLKNRVKNKKKRLSTVYYERNYFSSHVIITLLSTSVCIGILSFEIIQDRINSNWIYIFIVPLVFYNMYFIYFKVNKEKIKEIRDSLKRYQMISSILVSAIYSIFFYTSLIIISNQSNWKSETITTKVIVISILFIITIILGISYYSLIDTVIIQVVREKNLFIVHYDNSNRKIVMIV
ncbi:hypothetical protein KHM83_19570 [Fusibacter paucivorans]|uniref:Uncharacterized protein n=1 Tax=Fusibacter paucivorans TaxID=76009 RepID=A0ABS5PVT9_9FIRM|nr:hypothetical protein [Fusibacter paucivorans]MBS7528871.1 hypothetical protein [Fusibacter paucivorans]